MISVHADIPLVVEEMEKGAFHFPEKPFDPRQFRRILKIGIENYRLKIAALHIQSEILRLSGLERLLIGGLKQLKA